MFQCKNICKSYGTKHILSDINISVKPGARAAIIGASAAIFVNEKSSMSRGQGVLTFAKVLLPPHDAGAAGSGAFSFGFTLLSLSLASLSVDCSNSESDGK